MTQALVQTNIYLDTPLAQAPLRVLIRHRDRELAFCVPGNER